MPTNVNSNEVELARIPTKEGEEIVVRKLTDARGNTKFDIRTHVDKDTYVGWTKAGLRLTEQQVKDLTDALRPRRNRS